MPATSLRRAATVLSVALTFISAQGEHLSASVAAGGSPAPEIVVAGTGGNITDGEAATAAKFTDFGNVPIGTGIKTRDFYIANTGTARLHLTGNPRVTLSNPLDFNFIVTPQPSDSFVDVNDSPGLFSIRLIPTSAGPKTATVTILNDDPNHRTFTFTVAGQGVAPPTVGQPGSGEPLNDGATLLAVVSDPGGVPLTRAGVVYAPASVTGTPTLGDGVSAVIEQDVTALSTGGLALQVRDLAPGTYYNFRAFAQNSASGNDVSYTIVSSFATSLKQPDVSSLAVSDLTETSATVGGTVVGDHGEPITERGIRYGTAPFLLASDPGVVTVMASGTVGAFSIPLTGLTENTRYYFAAYALNRLGAGVTETGSFTTLATAQEIKLSGQGPNANGPATQIANGATAASVFNGTDFGATPLFNGLGPWGVAHRFTITNTGGAPLHLTGSPKVTIDGMDAADFTVANAPEVVTYPPVGYSGPLPFPVSPVAARGGTTTFSVLFQPSAAGLRTATVRVENDDPDERDFAFTVQGYGAVEPATAVGLATYQRNQLIHFEPAGTATVTAEVPISGVTPGEQIVALDTRPATGALLALGIASEQNQGTLYTLEPATGRAEPIGRRGSVAYLFTARALELGSFPMTHYEMAVNPLTDEVLVVCSNSMSFRIQAASGLPIDGDNGVPAGRPGVNPDGALLGAEGGLVRAAAYTDSVPGATRTALYTIEWNSAFIPSQTNQLSSRGPYGQSATHSMDRGLFDGRRVVLGFDIPANVRVPDLYTLPAQGYGYLLAESRTSPECDVMRVNLATGEVTSTKPLGQNVFGLTLLATPFEPAALAGPTVRNVTERLATIGGNVISNAGTGYIDAGVLISQTSVNPDPKLGGANVTVHDVSGAVGPFAYIQGELLPETTYSYRAFANNSPGPIETTYSTVATFTTTRVPAFLGESDYVISTRPERIIYPLRNDGTPFGTRYLVAGVNDPHVGYTNETLIIPQGYTGTFTYHISDGTEGGQASVYVSSARPATVYSGLLRDQNQAIGGSAHVAFSPNMRTATVLLKVGAAEARLLVSFPPSSATGVRQTAFGGLFVTTNEDGHLGIDLVLGPGAVQLGGTLQPRHTAGARARYNVALVSTDPMQPGGGFGFLLVRPDAGAVMVAVLPDGSVFTTSSSLRQDNTIPIFSSAGPGVVPRAVAGGDLVLADLAATDLTGSWMWRKPPQRAGVKGLYLGGVDTLLDVTGCRYAGEFHMDGAGTLGIHGGDLPLQFEQGDGVSVLSGRAALPVGMLKSWIAFRREGIFLAGLNIPGRGNVLGRGVYLPKSQTAWGLFPGTSFGGRLVLSVP